MTQIRGTAGYHLGSQSHFGGPSRPEATADTSPLDAIRQQTSKIEDVLDTMAEPLKPYLPVIGRFLIVVTFLEDALRIVTQWTDQLTYLHNYRHSMHIGAADSSRKQNTNIGRSSSRLDASLPHRQCSGDVLMLYPSYRPQAHCRSRRRTHGSSGYTGPRLRPHLRPQLLPS